MPSTLTALELRVRVDKLEQVLMYDYEPGTEAQLFGLYDSEGYRVPFNQASGPITRIRVLDMEGRSMASLAAPQALLKAG